MKPGVRLRIGLHLVVAEWAGGGRAFPSREVAVESADLLELAVAELVSRVTRKWNRRVVVELEPTLVQLRTLHDLPPVRAELLARLIDAQVHRFFRVNGHPMAIATIWLPMQPATPRLARAAAVSTGVLDAVRRGVARSGARITAIGVAGESTRLRFQGASIAAWSPLHAPLKLLVPTVLGLWAAVLIGSGLLLGARERQLDGELLQLRGTANRFAVARKSVVDSASHAHLLAAAGARQGWPLIAMGRIVGALPDSAYLMRLSVAGDGSGELEVVAPRAAYVVAAMEPVLSAPRMTGPAARERHGDGAEWERATIGFDAMPW